MNFTQNTPWAAGEAIASGRCGAAREALVSQPTMDLQLFAEDEDAAFAVFDLEEELAGLNPETDHTRISEIQKIQSF